MAGDKEAISMAVTAKGRRWELLHSLWIGWTFTLGFFNWVAFLYIGLRAKQRKWIYWGLFYSIPFVLAMLTPNSVDWLWNVIVALTIVLGIIGIIHAFRIRDEYLLHVEALQQGRSRVEEILKQQLGGRVNQGEEVTEQSVDASAEATRTAGASSRTTETLDKERPTRPTPNQPPILPEEPAHPSPPATSTNPTTDAVGTPKQAAAVPPETNRVSHTLQSGNELEYRISSSYPFPIAFGFRSLMSIVDYRDLYREQLRIAENILAFLASMSLTLLREQDRQKAEIDLEEYWRSGISPGDWKDIVGRCSKVFATYEDNPLALSISGLNIRSEKKEFGQDVAKLIQAKNDFKHDRGPTILEDIAEASQGVQERLKRCMEKLSFFGDYPIRQVEDFNVSRSGDEFFLKCLRYMGDHPSFPQEEVVFHRGLPRGDLFIELDRHHWVPLYPFIVTMTCSHCKARETYFVDLWDPRRGTARMKSFERGHTMNNVSVSEALARWNG